MVSTTGYCQPVSPPQGGTATAVWTTTPTRCPCCNRKAKPGFPFKYGWQYPTWTHPVWTSGNISVQDNQSVTAYNS